MSDVVSKIFDNITLDGNLQWDDNSKICCGTKDWFSLASISHLVSGYILMNFMVNIYLYIHKKKKLDTNGILIALFVTNIIHGVEDLLENSLIDGTSYSAEGGISRLSKCRNSRFLDHRDHDTLQNFMGDLISCFVGSLLASYVIYKLKFRMSVSTLIILVLLMLLGYIILCRNMEQQTDEPRSSL